MFRSSPFLSVDVKFRPLLVVTEIGCKVEFCSLCLTQVRLKIRTTLGITQLVYGKKKKLKFRDIPINFGNSPLIYVG